MIETIYILIFGIFTGLVVDIIWWKVPRLSKGDKFKAHEHYHISLELAIVSMIIIHYTQAVPAIFLMGLGFAFFLGEWDQLKEIIQQKVKPGHPFAIGSDHFKASTAIGIVLTVITITTYFYLSSI